MKGIPVIFAALALALAAPLEAAGPDLSLKTVVLDAGHGGKDPGCVSADGKTYEKTIVLKISDLLQKMITDSLPEVKVLRTRGEDKYVPLIDRAKFATRNDAALFISIHINAQDGGKNANGYSVHLLGQSQNTNRDTYAFNMNVCQRENSVIKLEDNYSTTYKGLLDDDPETAIFLNLMHTAYREQSLLFAQSVDKSLAGAGAFRRTNGIMQNNFAVLRLATMPAVLLELGFISNPEDLAALRDPEKLEKIAKALFDAFVNYKMMYDASVNVGAKPAPETPAVSQQEPAGQSSTAEKPAAAESKPAEPAAPAAVADSVCFGSQIFAGRTLLLPGDPKFLGYEPKVLNTGEIYKYIIGVCPDLEKAREENRKIREKYPQAFVVRIVGEKTSRP